MIAGEAKNNPVASTFRGIFVAAAAFGALQGIWGTLDAGFNAAGFKGEMTSVSGRDESVPAASRAAFSECVADKAWTKAFRTALSNRFLTSGKLIPPSAKESQEWRDAFYARASAECRRELSI